MRIILLSALAALHLYGANSQSILDEVAKLRQKYEECRQGQSAVLGIDPKKYNECEYQRKTSEGKVKGYQSRIANLETQIKELTGQLELLKKRNNALERELSQKKGIIGSLETTLTSRDKKYREAAARADALSTEANTIKVSRIERQKLTSSLVDAKKEIERLKNTLDKMGKERIGLEKQLADAKGRIGKQNNTSLETRDTKESKAVAAVSSDQNGRIKALQDELTKANALIVQLQKANTQKSSNEKVVTKVVEPTDKIIALQRELAAAQTTIANLKNNISASKVPTVIYKDRPVEKIVEKVVYKERPAESAKVITKIVEPTDKIVALQRELSAAQTTIANLKNNAKNTKAPSVVEKVVYKDRPVEKIVEKIVYKDRPVEKIVEKIVYRDRPAAAEKSTTKSLEAIQNVKVLHEPQKIQHTLATTKAASSKTADKVLKTPSKVQNVKQELTAETSKAQNTTAVSAKKGASAYRMAVNAPIYNAPGGRQIDTWEERRSFTAGVPQGGWVHITGYFVNRVWQRTADDENLWVKESDVIRR